VTIARPILSPITRITYATTIAGSRGRLSRAIVSAPSTTASAVRRDDASADAAGFDMTRGTMHSPLEQMNGLDAAGVRWQVDTSHPARLAVPA
jgi:hypothetical protein